MVVAVLLVKVTQLDLDGRLVQLVEPLRQVDVLQDVLVQGDQLAGMVRLLAKDLHTQILQKIILAIGSNLREKSLQIQLPSPKNDIRTNQLLATI